MIKTRAYVPCKAVMQMLRVASEWTCNKYQTTSGDHHGCATHERECSLSMTKPYTCSVMNAQWNEVVGIQFSKFAVKCSPVIHVEGNLYVLMRSWASSPVSRNRKVVCARLGQRAAASSCNRTTAPGPLKIAFFTQSGCACAECKIPLYWGADVVLLIKRL